MLFWGLQSSLFNFIGLRSKLILIWRLRSSLFNFILGSYFLGLEPSLLILTWVSIQVYFNLRASSLVCVILGFVPSWLFWRASIPPFFVSMWVIIQVPLQHHYTSRACGFLVHFCFRCLLSNQNRKQHHWPLIGRPSGKQLSTLVMLLKQLHPVVSPLVLLKVNQWFLPYTMFLVRKCLSFRVTSLTTLWPALPRRSPASLLPSSNLLQLLSNPLIMAIGITSTSG